MGIGHYKHVVAIIITIVKQLSTLVEPFVYCPYIVPVPSTAVLDFFSAVSMHIIITNSGRVFLQSVNVANIQYLFLQYNIY
jgi:hypothetical protein